MSVYQNIALESDIHTHTHADTDTETYQQDGRRGNVIIHRGDFHANVRQDITKDIWAREESKAPDGINGFVSVSLIMPLFVCKCEKHSRVQRVEHETIYAESICLGVNQFIKGILNVMYCVLRYNTRII